MKPLLFTLAFLYSGGAIAGESPIAFMLAQQPNVRAVVRSHRAVVGGQVVRASWYGGAGERLNRYTASGEPFRAMARIAAHRSLAFGTRLEVTNLSNGRSTIVRVIDRGPAFWTGRALDLSRGAAVDLGMISAGTASVSYRILN